MRFHGRSAVMMFLVVEATVIGAIARHDPVLAAGPAPAPAVPAAPAAAPGKNTWTRKQAQDVLKTAEEIRCLDKAEVLVDLKTVESGKDTVYDMRILRSTENRAYIEFLGPAEERGRRMLAKGKSYWSKFPDSKRVVAISRREMIGNSVFALADLFQLDAETDYDPAIVEELTEGGKKLWKLDLKAKHEEVPYARIEYWVETDGHFPVRARFYGVSGKHLKTMTVDTRREIAGRVRPEVTRMVDEVVAGRASWWKTKSMTQANPPDEVFNKDYLRTGGG